MKIWIWVSSLFNFINWRFMSDKYEIPIDCDWLYTRVCQFQNVLIFKQPTNTLQLIVRLNLDVIQCSGRPFIMLIFVYLWTIFFVFRQRLTNFFLTAGKQNSWLFRLLGFCFGCENWPASFLFYLFCCWHLSCQISIKSIRKIFICLLNILITVLYLNFFSIL